MPSLRHMKSPAEDPEQFPLEERVRWRAYELYVMQGNASGSESDDWQQAEDEILEADAQHSDRGTW